VTAPSTSNGVTVEPKGGSESLYSERAERFRSEAAALGSRSRLVSNLRGLSFGAAIVVLVSGTLGGKVAWLPLVLVFGLVFVGLVVWHSRVIAAEDHALRMARVNLDALSRVKGEWRTLPEDGARFVSDTHPYTSDIDVFGPGSLYQRVSVAHTRYGEDALARHLREPVLPEEIRRRQEAVRALVPRFEERQLLEALAFAVVDNPSTTGASATKRKPTETPNPESLLHWAEGAPYLSRRPLLVALSFVIPVITVGGAIGASVLGWPSAIWTVSLVASIAVIAAVRQEADRVFGAVSSTRGAFLRFGPMFEVIESWDLGSSLLGELRSGLLKGAVKPSEAMKRFEKIVAWFDLRHNGMIHPFANAFLLWDAHCLLRLEAWQKDVGGLVRGWFLALGEIEAESSFAGLAFDEPGFCWPSVTEGPARFEADDLGHPLLAPHQRVTNDVELSAPGRAMLVTGSNMSGKSTLLRSMGLAAVMAQAGAPVCASRLDSSPLAVRTSIKISDSLASGVSHFYAEVARLKGVLDATLEPTPVFFLLDEILHGTNSNERQIGARWLLSELVKRNAIGAVSTHDVELCRLPDHLMDHVIQCHLRESVQDGKMTFDYQLRPGPVSGGNALRLMQLVGLPVPLEEAKVS
jgi:hypothetical protein